MKTDHASTVEAALLQGYRERTPASARRFEAAGRSMPGGVTRSITYHPPYPLTFQRGEAAWMDDVDGNRYLDLQNNYTSLIHGHNHPAVVARILEVVRAGVVYNAPIDLQRELAEVIRNRVLSVDLVRFTNSGTEAVMNALRLARAATGRPKILKMEGAFHGSWDGVSLSVRPGVDPPPWPRPVQEMPGLAPHAAEGVLVAPYNDLETSGRIIRENRDALAAVIVEAVTWAPGVVPAAPAFLHGLADLCREAGILFVLDEVVSFRLSPGGAQELYGLDPDLTVFGKVIGGGLPIGALGGREEIMGRLDPRSKGYLPQSGTFSGSPVSMAAGLAALELLDADAVDRLNALGDSLRHRLSALLEGKGIPWSVTGMGSLGHLHLGPGPVRNYRESAMLRGPLHYWLYMALLGHGIFMDSRGHFALSSPMREEDVDRFIEAMGGALEEVRPLVG